MLDALYVSDEGKRRYEFMARQVFARFKALLMERSSYAYAGRTTISRRSTKNSKKSATTPTSRKC